MSLLTTLPDRATQRARPPGSPRPRRASGGRLVAIYAWGTLVVIAIGLGPALIADESSLRAPPLMGSWQWGSSLAVVVPLALAAATVVYGPWTAEILRWRLMVVGAGVATIAWSVALAAVDGWHRVSSPLASSHEYLAVVEHIEDPGSFLRTFVERLEGYPVHVRGHPPGMPLLLWGMDRLGMTGSGWAAALVLAGAGLATAATLVTLRSVAGEQIARRAAPFVAVAPAAVWLGTSTDAFYAGIIALGIALLVAGGDPTGRARDGTRCTTWQPPILALAGGVVLGLALFSTYGAVPLLALPAGIWVYRRNPRPLVWAAAAVALVTAMFWAAGFRWFDGLEATRQAYEAGVSQHRPYAVFVPLLNPAALALATGPAVAAGLGTWIAKRREVPVAVWLIPALALAAVAMANLSGLSKGEVERIWLPFAPWLLALTALLPRARMWLAAQVTAALSLQLVLHSPW